MNIKTNLLEDYVNFVDTTTRQNTYSKINIVLFVVIEICFSFIFYLNT